jgi:hypothetical protein
MVDIGHLRMEKVTILEKYIQFQLEHGKQPESVYLFMKQLKKKDADFFAVFSSFEAVDAFFWEHLFHNTQAKLEADKQYQQFGSSEKLSAFYFLWTQELLEHRSYLLMLAKHSGKGIMPTEKYLQHFRHLFLDYAAGIVASGIDEKQIADRKFISDQFRHGLWAQTVFLLNFWIKDTSNDFEDTDAAIEKTVRLIYKLMGENIFDEMLDLGKFIFQRSKKSFS